MRVVELQGRKVEVRGLTGAQIRTLKEGGVPINRFAFDPDMKSATTFNLDDWAQRILEMAAPADALMDLDTLENSARVKLFRAVMAETYGSGTEEKNS